MYQLLKIIIFYNEKTKNIVYMLYNPLLLQEHHLFMKVLIIDSIVANDYYSRLLILVSFDVIGKKQIVIIN